MTETVGQIGKPGAIGPIPTLRRTLVRAKAQVVLPFELVGRVYDGPNEFRHHLQALLGDLLQLFIW
jgi:hypothetical protein